MHVNIVFGYNIISVVCLSIGQPLKVKIDKETDPPKKALLEGMLVS